jgi:hypothetical protein
MNADNITAALADISADADPTRKAAKLASLCSGLFRERGIELVVVGGSAIELLTEGAYASGWKWIGKKCGVLRTARNTVSCPSANRW